MIKALEKMKENSFLVLLFCVSLAISAFIICLNIPKDLSIMGYSFVRVELLEQFMQVIREGKIPDFLSAYEHSYGYVFYLPYLGVLFNIHSGAELLLFVQLSAMFNLMLFFPLEIYLSFHNRIAALAAPILLHIFCGNILYGYKTDSFWGMCWVTVLSMPLVYKVFAEKWSRKALGIVILTGCICTLGNVMRNHNGFLILIILTGVLLIKMWKEKEKSIQVLLGMLIFFFLYESVSTWMPLFFGRFFGLSKMNNGAFIWHSLLCGLGYYQNEYGFECNDGVIAQVVKQYYNYRIYPSDEYMQACKRLFFTVLKENPIFILKTYFRKLFDMLKVAFEYTLTSEIKNYYALNLVRINIHNIFFPSTITVVLSLVAAKLKRSVLGQSIKKYKSVLIMTILGIFIGTIEGVIFIPEIRYGINSLLCIGFVFFWLALILILSYTQKSIYGEQ